MVRKTFGQTGFDSQRHWDLQTFFTPREWEAIAQRLWLTPQQTRILGLLLQVQRDKDISREMGINVWTVRAHLTKIFRKLGVADRVELVLLIFATHKAVQAEV